MPPKDEHQSVVEFLHLLLGYFVRLQKLGKVRIAPFTMRAIPDGSAREPDLLFLATDNLYLLTSKELNGPADLAIEVISDDSVTRDKDDKFYEYQAAGVKEYWIIDPRPRRLRAEFYVLDEQGRYQPVPLSSDNVYHSTVVTDFRFKVDWLWRQNVNPLVALAQIVGAERIIEVLRAGDNEGMGD
jgi:Uma2 family endonuclease